MRPLPNFRRGAVTNWPLDGLPMGGCRTRMFRGTEQKRPSTNVTGGVMVQLHKLFGVLQVDR